MYFIFIYLFDSQQNRTHFNEFSVRFCYQNISLYLLNNKIRTTWWIRQFLSLILTVPKMVCYRHASDEYCVQCHVIPNLGKNLDLLSRNRKLLDICFNLTLFDSSSQLNRVKSGEINFFQSHDIVLSIMKIDLTFSNEWKIDFFSSFLPNCYSSCLSQARPFVIYYISIHEFIIHFYDWNYCI